MPFHNRCARLWCARMGASFSAGQRHWMWLCVSAGAPHTGTQSTCGGSYHTPLVEMGIAGERASNRLEHLFLGYADLHCFQYLAQRAPDLIRSKQPGCRARQGKRHRLLPPSSTLWSKCATDALLRSSLRQIFPKASIPLDLFFPLNRKCTACLRLAAGIAVYA